MTGFFDDGEAVMIFPVAKQVDVNSFVITAEMGKSFKLYQTIVFLEAKTCSLRPRTEIIPDDPNETRGTKNRFGSRVL